MPDQPWNHHWENQDDRIILSCKNLMSSQYKLGLSCLKWLIGNDCTIKLYFTINNNSNYYSQRFDSWQNFLLYKLILLSVRISHLQITPFSLKLHVPKMSNKLNSPDNKTHKIYLHIHLITLLLGHLKFRLFLCNNGLQFLVLNTV